MQENTLYTGDNLYILNGMNSASVDLIYLDPPFNSKRLYAAPLGSRSAGISFKDMWQWQDVDEGYLERLVGDYPNLVKFIESIEELHSRAMMAYATYMTQRIIEMHRILKPTGSIYLHCDPTASHYLKIILDRIFGKNNFRNEVVWCYDRWDAKSYDFQKMHDCIFRYSKSENYLFNQLTEIDSKRQKTLDRGYTTNLLKDGTRQLIIYRGNEKRDNIKRLTQKSKFDKIIVKEPTGRPLKDWWEIPFLHPKSKERIGYPTQKPLALLHRIIKASSKKGDVVLDPFCGCATTCVAAEQLERRWVGIDIEKKAADLVVERLSDATGLFSNFIHRSDIPKRSDVENVDIGAPKNKNAVKEKLLREYGKRCNGCWTKMEKHHLEIDHIIPKSRGGGDYYENYQLLCGNCNRIKGDRPMEFLRQKLKVRDAHLAHKITFGGVSGD